MKENKIKLNLKRISTNKIEYIKLDNDLWNKMYKELGMDKGLRIGHIDLYLSYNENLRQEFRQVNNKGDIFIKVVEQISIPMNSYILKNEERYMLIPEKMFNFIFNKK